VITICRNVLPDLRETVESVLAQGYPRLEYWIVDGASTDGTPEYLSTLAHRGVRFVSEPDRGISDAMNKGVRLATGELVAHLHTGDRYLDGALDAVARAYRSQPADVLCGAMRKREGNSDVVYHAAPDRLPYDMTIHHPATFTRRVLFERNGGFDGTLRNAMDYEFFLRLLVAGARFRALPEPLVAVAAGGQSDRSLWETLRETHAARRRLLASGFQRAGAYLLLLYARGLARRGLQRAGLAGLAARVRRRYALALKG
jgi:glycosyltransferase